MRPNSVSSAAVEWNTRIKLLKCSAYAGWLNYAIDIIAIAEREDAGRVGRGRYLRQLVLFTPASAKSFLPCGVRVGEPHLLLLSQRRYARLTRARSDKLS